MLDLRIIATITDLSTRLTLYRANQKNRALPFQMNGTRKSILDAINVQGRVVFSEACPKPEKSGALDKLAKRVKEALQTVVGPGDKTEAMTPQDFLAVDQFTEFLTQQKGKIQATGVFGKESELYIILTDIISALSGYCSEQAIDALNKENEAQRLVIERLRQDKAEEGGKHVRDVRKVERNNKGLQLKNKQKSEELKVLRQQNGESRDNKTIVLDNQALRNNLVKSGEQLEEKIQRTFHLEKQVNQLKAENKSLKASLQQLKNSLVKFLQAFLQSNAKKPVKEVSTLLQQNVKTLLNSNGAAVLTVTFPEPKRKAKTDLFRHYDLPNRMQGDPPQAEGSQQPCGASTLR